MTETAIESLVGVIEGYQPTEEGFGPAFVDSDEIVAEPARHRRIHGGFTNTETLFTIYLPSVEQFEGRVLQYLEGGAGGHENLLSSNALAFGGTAAPWQFAFAFDEMGAILCESNQGHPPNAGHTGFHNDVYLFGASAETARFAKWLASTLLGADVHHTYVFGASGGGHRSFQCVMRRPDVYDGGVPEVFGVNPGLYWSVFGRAVAALGGDVEKVRNAMEPGGNGDPFDGLSFEQREVLADLFRLGFPRGATTQLAHISVFPFTLYNTIEANPAYFHDFWHTKGYLGHDDPSRLKGLVHLRTTVREVRAASDLLSSLFVAMQLATAGATLQTPYGALLDVEDPRSLTMAKLTVVTGKAAGREMVIADVTDGSLVPFGEKCPELFEGVEPGDEVEIDNSDWIAFTYLYLHNVEWNVPGLHGGDTRVPADYSRFAVDGTPVHAQTGTAHYDLDEVAAFPGKMIFIGAALDICIWPTIFTSFDQYVRLVLGNDVFDHYRIWLVENSTHGRAEMGAALAGGSFELWRTRLVDYEAVGAAALTAMQKWVEEGIEPPLDTAYALTDDKDLIIPAEPSRRGGVQPSVHLTANGESLAEVKVGEVVHFEGVGAVPPGAGTFVEAEMDFDGSDTWPFQAEVGDTPSERISVGTTHAYDSAGTFFPVLRVGSHLDGAKRSGACVRNLCRVRVVVSE